MTVDSRKPGNWQPSQGNDFRSERRQSELRDFEELLSKRNADDRDAPDQTEQEVADRHLDSEKDQPKDIQKQRYGAAAEYDILSERKKRHARKFEALFSERNTDDRYA